MDEEDIEEWFQEEREKAIEERIQNKKGLERKEADARYEAQFQGILAGYKKKLNTYLVRADRLQKFNRMKKQAKNYIKGKLDRFKERFPGKKNEADE